MEHVGFAIGTAAPVCDSLASAFAVQFYERLAGGEDLLSAFRGAVDQMAVEARQTKPTKLQGVALWRSG